MVVRLRRLWRLSNEARLKRGIALITQGYGLPREPTAGVNFPTNWWYQ